MEIWKDIKGFEGRYQVSNMGRVKNVKRNTLLNPFIDPHGYYSVSFRVEFKKDKHYKIHRLVAETFIPNPDNKPQVDHIDTDKSNNKASNLKWVTNKENFYNPLSEAKHKNKINRKVKCKTTGVTFDSIKEASEFYNVDRVRISYACKGKQKWSGKLPDGTKLEWCYVEGELQQVIIIDDFESEDDPEDTIE